MATITSMVRSGYSASNNSLNSIKKQISDTKEQISALSKNTTLSESEKKSLTDEYNEKLTSLSDQLTDAEDNQVATIQSNASGLLGSSSSSDSGGNIISQMLGSGSSGNTDTLDTLLGAGASLTSVKAMNKARVGIENRARTLTAEIKMDQMRGIDTSSKKESLANLTENLSIMDNNLSSNVDKTLTEDTTTSTASKPLVIDKIKDQLASNAEALAKEYEDGYKIGGNSSKDSDTDTTTTTE